MRNTVGASRLPVILLGTHTGLSTGADGGSHCCPEDLALMRSIPGMQIFIPACSDDVAPMFTFALDANSPCYIRVPRNDLWSSSTDRVPYLDLQNPSLRCWRTGEDIAIITAGLMLPRVMAVAEQLSANGHSIAVYDIPYLGIDTTKVREILRQFRAVMTVEDHWPAGGLGEMFASLLTDEPDLTLRTIAATHRFPSSGEVETVLDDMGLGIATIHEAAVQLLPN